FERPRGAHLDAGLDHCLGETAAAQFLAVDEHAVAVEDHEIGLGKPRIHPGMRSYAHAMSNRSRPRAHAPRLKWSRCTAGDAVRQGEMPHDPPLIATIVAGLGLAFVFGTIAQRFRIPPLVGYLLAGVAVGPFTPGFVADQALATELAELGIILLMFGVGLHFSLNDLLSVRAIAVPGAIAQILVATLMGLGLALLMGWTVGAGLVFGLALSVASTVVLLRALQERRLMDTERGKIAVGWLIVEDLAMVLALVLFPAVASFQGGDGAALVSDPLATRFGLG